MTNQEKIQSLIRQMSGQSNILTIPRLYITITGDVRAALFLSQCIYWSDRSNRTDGSFYKTYKEWLVELALTRHEIDSARKVLEEKGFLKTEVHRANNLPTVHWYVNMEAIADSVLSEISKTGLPNFSNSVLPNFSNSIAENQQNINIDYNIDYTTEINNNTTAEIDDLDQSSNVIHALRDAEAVYRKVTGFFTIPAGAREAVGEAIFPMLDEMKSLDAVVEYLLPFWEAWKERKYNRHNCNWVTDWAVTGEIPQIKEAPKERGYGDKKPKPKKGYRDGEFADFIDN